MLVGEPLNKSAALDALGASSRLQQEFAGAGACCCSAFLHLFAISPAGPALLWLLPPRSPGSCQPPKQAPTPSPAALFTLEGFLKAH